MYSTNTHYDFFKQTHPRGLHSVKSLMFFSLHRKKVWCNKTQHMTSFITLRVPWMLPAIVNMQPKKSFKVRHCSEIFIEKYTCNSILNWKVHAWLRWFSTNRGSNTPPRTIYTRKQQHPSQSVFQWGGILVVRPQAGPLNVLVQIEGLWVPIFCSILFYSHSILPGPYSI